MFRFSLVFALGTALLHADPQSLCDSAAGNLVKNCGYELGDLSFWTTGGNYDPTTTFVAPGLNNSGNFALSFGAVKQPATVSQTLNNTPGKYQFSFYLSQECDTNDPQVDCIDTGDWSFAALWNGSPVLSLFDTPISPFTLYSFTVVGAGNDTIEFDGRNDPFYWALDDVEVVAEPDIAATPEVGSVALLLTVSLPVVFVIRRRSSAA